MADEITEKPVDPTVMKVLGSAPGEYSKRDELRARVKAAGIFVAPLMYSISQQILDASTFIKSWSGATAWILVGGIAGGIVYWYERRFGRQADTRWIGQNQFPSTQQSSWGNQFPPQQSGTGFPTFPTGGNSGMNPQINPPSGTQQFPPPR